MRSKTSKTSRRKPADPAHSQHRLKLERLCSEAELSELAKELWLAIRNMQSTTQGGTRRALFISLEGEMGAGKSTFARALLRSENPALVFKGSPTFALAHEYVSGGGVWIHTDLYRLKSEEELREAGIEAYFWEREQAIVVVEWLSLFPALEASLLEECKANDRAGFRVRLEFSGSSDERLVSVESLGC